MTQTDFLHLNKPADSDAINISALNTNADLIDAAIAALSGAVGGIAVTVIAADDTDNPTAEYETPAPVLCMTVTGTSGTTALGFKVAASSTGYLFARTLASGTWSDWSRILNVTNDREDFGVLMFARRSDEPETDSSEPETEG